MFEQKNMISLVLFILSVVALLVTFVAARGTPESGLLRIIWFGGAPGATLSLMVTTIFVVLFGRLPMDARIVGGVFVVLGVLIGGLALAARPDNDFLIPFLKNAGYSSAIVLIAFGAFAATRAPMRKTQED